MTKDRYRRPLHTHTFTLTFNSTIIGLFSKHDLLIWLAMMTVLDSRGSTSFYVLFQQIYTGLVPLRPGWITGHRETPVHVFSTFYSALDALLNLQHSSIYVFFFQRFVFFLSNMVTNHNTVTYLVNIAWFARWANQTLPEH